MSEEEMKAIEWLKDKPQECTSLINSCSYIGNKKEYAKDRTMFKTILNLIQKQQAQIDEMAKFISGLDIEEDICSNVACYKECDKMSYGECEACIKQYFKKKVEEENERNRI